MPDQGLPFDVAVHVGSLLAVMGYFFIVPASGVRQWYIPLEIIAYPVLAFVIGNLLASRPRTRQLKKAGRQAKVMGNNHPELHRALIGQSQLLALKKPPDMYVVDDEDKILFVVRRALARFHATCQVQTATNGQQALELARTAPFDLVVTDLRMPEMDGIALTEALRQEDARPAVIWMTAYHCSAQEDEMKRLGVCCCLDKPIEIDEIRRVVSEALWPPGLADHACGRQSAG